MNREAVFYINDELELFLKRTELEKNSNIRTSTIFSPDASDNKFNLGGACGAYKNKIYFFWKSSPQDEDTLDTEVRYSFSEDEGKTWHESKILCKAANDGFLRAPGGCYSDDKHLIVYVQKVNSYYGEGDTFTEYYISEDGEIFEGPYPLMEVTADKKKVELRAAASGSVLRCKSGRLIMGFQGNINRYDRRQFVVQMYYTDNPDGVSGWKRAEFPLLERPGAGQGAECEPGYYQRQDGAVVLALRDLTGSKRVLGSVSYDEGEHYSQAQLTNMPDSNSMQCGAVLNDGMVFLVNNPNENERIPLALHLSKDGVIFTKSIILRGQADLQTKRFSGLYKGVGYSYPCTCIYNNYIYVFYATNKEDIEVSIIGRQILLTCA